MHASFFFIVRITDKAKRGAVWSPEDMLNCSFEINFLDFYSVMSTFCNVRYIEMIYIYAIVFPVI